jgi:nucleoside-diphosphate-sugar epimerase
MKVLFVGGTGVISSECAALVTAQGHELTLVTRGRSQTAPPPPGARLLYVDATDSRALRAALGAQAGGERFDAVVQFVAFEPGHVADDVVTFAPRANHYVFVSTAAAYRSFDHFVLLNEDTEQANPHWEYARKKAEGERVLREYAADANLPFTIVRPAHTYGASRIPGYVGNSRHPWTLVDRMRRGADIIIPGDGTSVWTVTHARDVAVGLVGLLGNERAFGKAVGITGDEALTWNGIHETIAAAVGLTAPQFSAIAVHVPTDAIVAAEPSTASGLYGDKMHGAVFDTSRIRSLVPDFAPRIAFAQGMRETLAWFEANPERRTVDAEANAMFDLLGRAYRAALRDVAGVG